MGSASYDRRVGKKSSLNRGWSRNRKIRGVSRPGLVGGSVAAGAFSEARNADVDVRHRSNSVPELVARRGLLTAPLLLQERQPVLPQAHLGERGELAAQLLSGAATRAVRDHPV